MSEEKKIIIDEDWKTQVEAERDELEREVEETPNETPSEPPPQGQMPPASFEMLLTMFATEALVALGQMPNPVSNEVSVSPEHARYSIDMLQMLEEKTKGNLDPNEEKILEDLLHQLRMLFVAK